MKRLVTLPILVVLFALAGGAGEVPRPAPPLDVMSPSGDKISLAAFKGKVVLLEFFLTDCPHCQNSARIIMPIYRDWRSRGLEVLGVAINQSDQKRLIPEFAQRFGVTYLLGMGRSSMVNEFANLSEVARVFVPYVFIIDRKGVIRYEHPGGDAFFRDEETNFRTELDLLLKEGTVARKALKKPAAKGE